MDFYILIVSLNSKYYMKERAKIRVLSLYQLVSLSELHVKVEKKSLKLYT